MRSGSVDSQHNSGVVVASCTASSLLLAKAPGGYLNATRKLSRLPVKVP
jgi:hypothetical protein